MTKRSEATERPGPEPADEEDEGVPPEVPPTKPGKGSDEPTSTTINLPT